MREISCVICYLFLNISVFAQNGSSLIDTVESAKYASLAVEALRLNEADTAIEYFSKSLEYNPKNALGYSGLAYYAYQAENYNQVVIFASSGLELFDNNQLNKNEIYLDLIKFMAYSLVFLGKPKEAIPYLSEAIDIEESDYYNFHLRATAYDDTGELELALEDIQRAYLYEPDDPGVLATFGALLYKIGDYINALNYLTKSNILLDAEVYFPNYYYLGMSNFFLGNHSQCIDNLKIFLRDSMGEIQYPKDYMEAKLHIGVSYFIVEEYKSAIPYLKDVAEYAPQNVYVKYRHAFAVVAADDSPHALNLLEDYSESFPNEGAFNLTLGDLFRLKADSTNARHHYLAALDKGTEVSDTLLFYEGIAAGLAHLNDTLGLIRCWETLTALLPEATYAYLQLLNVYQSMYVSSNGVLYRSEIISVLDNLIKLNAIEFEKEAYFRATRGIFLISIGDYRQGLEDLTEALTLHPFSEYYALRALSIMYHEVERAKEDDTLELDNHSLELILQDVQRAIESGHRTMDALLLKTSVLLLADRHSEACLAASEAVKNGAVIDKELMKHICNGKKLKKGSIDWEFDYNLSGFNERFPD